MTDFSGEEVEHQKMFFSAQLLHQKKQSKSWTPGAIVERKFQETETKTLEKLVMTIIVLAALNQSCLFTDQQVNERIKLDFVTSCHIQSEKFELTSHI